ncbi:MAG: proline dehydrogenase family protein [Saprospiraceae bacterium]
MKKSAIPASQREKIEKMDATIKNIIAKNNNSPQVDFKNTENAFAYKTDDQLRKAAWLFGLMNKPWLVGIGSKIGLAAIRMHLPFVTSIVKATIFDQFCGGTSLEKSVPKIEDLYNYGSQTILDYGAEGKETEEDFDGTMNEALKAARFAEAQASVPIIVTKISGMARHELLEAIQADEYYSPSLQEEYQRVLQRLHTICAYASERNVGVFFDAEETWIQDAIDQLVTMMMEKYNQERVIVYNTFQMYRHDRLKFLKKSHARAVAKGYMLGAKLVRGAYMDKERERAKEKGYPSPIQPDKAATDRDYNDAVRFVVANYEKIASCNASHNAESSLLQAQLITDKGIDRNHPHLNFCQLYGMSDHITFNLSKAGYNVAKYVPYGTVREVVPYLIRRAQENSSVTGDMTREHKLVLTEMKRRGLI